jgi:hypothetical protein
VIPVFVPNFVRIGTVLRPQVGNPCFTVSRARVCVCVWKTLFRIRWTYEFCGKSLSVVHVMIKLSLSLTKHHSIKTYWRSRVMAPRILNLGSRRRWMVSFTTCPLYPLKKSPCYPPPIGRRLCGPDLIKINKETSSVIFGCVFLRQNIAQCICHSGNVTSTWHNLVCFIATFLLNTTRSASRIV